MSEIYRNTSQYVYLDVLNGTTDGTPTATANGQPLNVTGPTTVGASQRWTTTVGFAQTQEVGEVKVVWNFTVGGVPATKTDYLDVVVPLADLDDIRTELDIPTDITDADIVLAERRVRRIIEKHCGQQFLPTTETIIVKARGDKIMWLPKRLISVTTMTDIRTGYVLDGYVIRENGWALLRTLQNYIGDQVTVTGPIFDPFTLGNYSWPAGVEWTIDGRWGWERVPASVQEAALILIEQRLCPESMYRDTYLMSMKASDWRFDYSNGAFSGTGNVVADQLLSEYRAVQAAVI